MRSITLVNVPFTILLDAVEGLAAYRRVLSTTEDRLRELLEQSLREDNRGTENSAALSPFNLRRYMPGLLDKEELEAHQEEQQRDKQRAEQNARDEQDSSESKPAPGFKRKRQQGKSVAEKSKRTYSPETLKRMADAQKKRWAKIRKENKIVVTTKQGRTPRGKK